MNNIDLAKASSSQLREAVVAHASAEVQRVSIVSAAPGSGKSTALLTIAQELLTLPGVQRVAIAAQTNNQANDLGIKFANKFAGKTVYRLASTLTKRPAAYKGLWVNSTNDIGDSKDCVIIATAAKWGQSFNSKNPLTVDYVLIDEAFQMAWATLVQISCLGPNFVLIGDEGQIEPVVPIDATRWESSNYPPHWPAPKTFDNHADKFGEKFMRGALEYCWRLPEASVSYIKPFYERLGVDVKSVASVSDRQLIFDEPLSSSNKDATKALEMMADGAPVLLTIADEANGAPIDGDIKVADEIRDALRALLKSNARFEMRDSEDYQNGPYRLKVSDIAICSTKRAMNALIENVVQEVLAEVAADQINPEFKDQPNFGMRIDTPERLQGLEFKVFFAVHPLSTAQHPSEFDLETGRLCVMASRHQIGLLMFSREHVLTTLDVQMSTPNQAPGRPDRSGIGHRIHRGFIGDLVKNNRIIKASR